VTTFVLLVVAGVGAGLTGSIAGLASLISYPALLAAGLPPITANVTNTVALVFSGVGSISASRPELRQQSRRLRRLVPAAVAGGTLGAYLLIRTPSDAFEKIVPVLIAVASVAVTIRRKPTDLAAHHDGPVAPSRDSWWLVAVTFSIGIYGGYFGAAAGVLLLALILLATGELLPRSNAIKNVLLGSANLVAATGFVLFAHVAWLSALPLAIGLLVGARIGPRIVRRAPATGLRMMIGACGLGLAIYLGVGAYH